MIEQFCEQHFSLNAISAKRQRDQKKALLAFELYCAPTRSEDAGPDEIEKWMVYLLDKRKLHPNTVRWYVNMIRPYFEWLRKKGHITGDHLATIKAIRNPVGSTTQNEPNPYERREILQFWQDLNTHRPLAPTFVRRWRKGTSSWNRVWKHAERLQYEAIAVLALYCGLRQQEIRVLSLDDIDPLNAYVPVQTAKQRGAIQSVRKVPYPESARNRVEAWIEFRKEIDPPHDYPWLTLGRYEMHHKNPLRPRPLAELFASVGSGYKLHRFRHTCATEWLNAGVELEKVRMIMGHTSLEQTLAYAKITSSKVRRSMDRFENVFRRAIEPGLEPTENDDDSQEIA